MLGEHRVYYGGLFRSLAFFFFFNDTATTEIYTLSLHDALPIFKAGNELARIGIDVVDGANIAVIDLLLVVVFDLHQDRKSTRLNSSHQITSYAVFCLKNNKSTSTKPIEQFNPASNAPLCYSLTN